MAAGWQQGDRRSERGTPPPAAAVSWQWHLWGKKMSNKGMCRNLILTVKFAVGMSDLYCGVQPDSWRVLLHGDINIVAKFLLAQLHTLIAYIKYTATASITQVVALCLLQLKWAVKILSHPHFCKQFNCKLEIPLGSSYYTNNCRSRILNITWILRKPLGASIFLDSCCVIMHSL